MIRDDKNSQPSTQVQTGAEEDDSTPRVRDDGDSQPSTQAQAGAEEGDSTTIDLRTTERLAGGYRILRPHASGGLGEVSVALDEVLHREVALKQIRRELADDPQSRARFLVEAEVTGGLEHPGVVPVYALGFDSEGRPYYTMRFIRGESLKDTIRRSFRPPGPDFGSLDFRALLGRFLDVCNIIAYAHSRGVLHRDLKPSNVMLGKYGETLVVDWGLAKSLDRPESASGPLPDEPALQPISGSSLNPTLLGTTVGTPKYMSPEQALGRLDRLGPASDVYSLGATLYCLLTGRPPLADAEDVAEVIRRVAVGDIPPARAVCRAVPQALEAICRKAMAVRPADRYGSPLELAGDLQRWLADEPIPGIREPLGRRLSRWERRNRLLIRAVGAALLAVTTISLAATFAVQRARGREREALVAEKRQKDFADRQRARADAQRRASQERACGLLFDRGLELADRQEYGRALLWLARALAEVPDHRPDLAYAIRTTTDSCLHLVTAPIAILEHEAAPVVRMAYGPDRRTVATGAADGSVRLWDAATGQPRGGPLPHEGSVVALRFAAAAPVLLVATDTGRATAHDAATGNPIGPAIRLDAPIVAADITSDGRRAALGSRDGRVRVWDLASGVQVGEEVRFPSAVVSVSFSADGRAVLGGSDDGAVRISDAATGVVRGPALSHGGRLTAALFRPDGRAVLTTGFDGFARLWDVATGEPLLPPLNHRGAILEAAFRIDGGQILTTGHSTVTRLWDATTGAEQSNRSGALGHQNYIESAAYSPDGRVVVTGSLDRTASLCDLEGERRAGNTLPHPRKVIGVEFAPDARTLLTLDDGGGVRLWRIGSTGPPSPPIRLPAPVLSIACTPDGRRFLAGGETGKARLREAATGQAVGPLLNHPSLIWAVALSPDGRRAVTAGYSRTAQVWDLASGQPIGAPMPSDREVVAVAFSPDGSLLATGSRDRTVRLFDAATGVPRDGPLPHAERILSVGFTRDGGTLVTGCEDGLVRFWDVATLRPLGRTLRHEDGVRALAFHPEGRLLATGSLDGTARLWDIATGQPVGPPLPHDGWVTCLAFSPDGKTLATGSLSRTLRFWEVATGLALGPSLWHERAVWCLAFRPDGRAVVTGSDDRGVRTWPVPRSAEGDPRRLVHQARMLAALRLDDDGTFRALTATEWQSERRAADEGVAAPPPNAGHAALGAE